ncbi:MAG: hypothetical protein LIP01_16240 [Tannerellaceae bacterium]|nr:hypothetical protein [Tannerellaceae bacterium]
MNAKNILSLFTDLVKIPRHKAKMKKQRKENPHLHVGKDLNVFKDTKIGKRCFIVGNGPSLAIDDLNMIAGEDSFASNGIFGLLDKTVWRPTYYFLGIRIMQIRLEKK